MYNYLGLGIDAKITENFDTLRTKYPALFKNRVYPYIYSIDVEQDVVQQHRHRRTIHRHLQKDGL